MGPKVPTPPTYTPPPSYQSPTYTQPAPYQSPMDPWLVAPPVLSPTQVMQQGAGVESMLPKWMQLGNDPMNPALLGQFGNNYYNQNVAPALEALKSNLMQKGQQYGSFGGAAYGQAAAQGANDKFGAGLNFGQQLFGNQLQGRASYFNGGPQVAQQQNASDVNRGMQLAQLMGQNSQNQNQYNMNSAGMANNFNLQANQNQNQYGFNSAGMANNFGLDNYKNHMSAYGANSQNAFNNTYALGSVGKAAFQGLGAMGSFFKGGAGGGGSPTMIGAGPTFGSTYGAGGILGNQALNQVGGFGGIGGNPGALQIA